MYLNYVRELFEQDLIANLELYVNGKLTAGKRRVLTTEQVGEALERVKNQKDLIKHLFKKCGFLTIWTGTRILTNIKGTEGHKTPMKKMTVKKMMMTDLKNRAQSRTRDVIVLVMYILF